MMDARDAWNRRYLNRGSLYGREPNEFVVSALAGLAPRKVLDLGCGQGRNAVWLAVQGHTVTGLDLSDVAIGQAREFARHIGVDVQFEAIDIARVWQPEPVYDLVVLSYFQLPGATRTAAHHKAVEALVDGGRIFLIAHHADNLEHGVGGPPMPEVLFTEADLESDFKALEITRMGKVYRKVDTPDGAEHAIDILMEGVKRS